MYKYITYSECTTKLYREENSIGTVTAHSTKYTSHHVF